MAAKSFTAAAYWSVETARQDWVVEAFTALQPAVVKGLITVAAVGEPTPFRLDITAGEASMSMTVMHGKGGGLISPSPHAGRIVAVMVALRSRVGDLELADELGKHPIPRMPRQNYPLYGMDWPAVRDIAMALGSISDRSLGSFKGIGQLL